MIRLRRKGLRKDDRGNMAVEFALLSPIFLLLLAAVADYGIAALELSELRAAARAGVQAALNDRDDLDGTLAAAEAVAPDADIEAVKVCGCSDGTEVDCSTGVCPTGGVRQIVTVTASRDLVLMIPWPGFEDPMPLEGLARVRVR